MNDELTLEGTDNSLDSGSPPAEVLTEVTPIVETSVVETPAVEIPVVEQQESSPDSVAELPDWAKAEITKLRKENADRRVTNKSLSSHNEQLTNLVQQVAVGVSATAPEQDSVEVPAVPETPDQMESVMQNVLDTLGSLSHENMVMRVAAETGLSVELLQNLNGDSYETLSAGAAEIATYAQTIQTDAVKPVAKPPNTPSGEQAVGITDAQRQQTYFGGGNSNAGVFDNAGGGVINHNA